MQSHFFQFEMPPVAIIGGSGFFEFPELENATEERIDTPFGDVFGMLCGNIGTKSVVFMARHGAGHRLPPHKINYRANIWALKQLGVKKVISLNAVGGINSTMPPGCLVIPDQIIDYTSGRPHTFADLLSDDFNHVDFSYPFSKSLQQILVDKVSRLETEWQLGGVYGCTQGPRLETVAEINRLARDGCDLVGMTLMPEAALAREVQMEYVSLCAVVNWAAGRSADLIALSDIREVMKLTAVVIRRLLVDVVQEI